MKKFVLATALAFAASCLPALADDMAPAKVMGSVLVNAKGMTLYYFDKDSATKSACTGSCATLWPPLTASAGAKAMTDWTVISRDGGKQWAYKDHPLYTYAKDKKSGDMMGNGIGGVWHEATP